MRENPIVPPIPANTSELSSSTMSRHCSAFRLLFASSARSIHTFDTEENILSDRCVTFSLPVNIAIWRQSIGLKIFSECRFWIIGGRLRQVRDELKAFMVVSKVFFRICNHCHVRRILAKFERSKFYNRWVFFINYESFFTKNYLRTSFCGLWHQNHGPWWKFSWWTRTKSIRTNRC